MTAFEKWFQYKYQRDPIAGATYLFNCALHGDGDSLVWDWIKKTGRKDLSAKTFIKASKLILKSKEGV